MKIYLENIVFSCQKIGGISVVWYELLKRIIENKTIEYSLIEYQNSDENILRKSLVIDHNKLIKKNLFLFRLRKFFNVKMNINEKYIFHSSDYRVSLDRSAINIVTVHDFLYFKSDWRGIKIWFIRKMHQMQMIKALKNADVIISISKATKDDLIKYIPSIQVGKIKVVHNGVSDDFFPVDVNDNELPFPTQSYCLFIGSRSKYKNFNQAVEACARYNKNLVIVGQQLNSIELKFVISHLDKNKYRVLSGISNQLLNVLYNGAFCLLYPSSFEGFGIPIIEAQKANCPVIAQNISAISEIIGDNPLLMESISTDCIIKSLKRLEDNETRKYVTTMGLQNSMRFSWEKNYKNIKKIYNDLIMLNGI